MIVLLNSKVKTFVGYTKLFISAPTALLFLILAAFWLRFRLHINTFIKLKLNCSLYREIHTKTIT